jgi:leader peptidase (prepilin peptidase)/N-methyltransferase
VHWQVAVALLVVGIPAGAGINRIVDAEGRRRPDARRRTRLPGRTVLVVVATSGLFAGCGLAFGVEARVAVAVAFCAALVAIAAIDAEQRIVPNRIVIPGTVVVTAAQTAITPSVEWLAAALGAGAFFLVAALIYPGGMGMGDVKLALLLGAMLGSAVSVAIAVALVTALVPSVAILVRHGRRGRTMAIPFAPFLAIGGVVALFAGHALLHAYLHSFG